MEHSKTGSHTTKLWYITVACVWYLLKGVANKDIKRNLIWASPSKSFRCLPWHVVPNSLKNCIVSIRLIVVQHDVVSCSMIGFSWVFHYICLVRAELELLPRLLFWLLLSRVRCMVS